MYKFGKKSTEKLNTCHRDIREIMNEVIKIYDVSILEGIRSTERQMMLFKEGKSKLNGVDKLSKHQPRIVSAEVAGIIDGEMMTDEDGNPIASMAIDILPWKKGTNAFSGDEKDTRRFYFLMGIVKGVAERLLSEGRISHKVRFGIDWDNDDIYTDQSFDDAPHWELIPA